MIEDDIRELIGSKLPDTEVYSRLIPIHLPTCIVVLSDGGTPQTSSIRRARHRITLLSIAATQYSAKQALVQARDALIEGTPFDTASAHYYTATALADGSLTQKALNGPRYIESVDMEVVASL